MTELKARQRRTLRRRLSEAQGHRCCDCGREMIETDRDIPERCTLKRIVPKSAGGETRWDNCAACCLGCSRGERNRPWIWTDGRKVFRRDGVWEMGR